MVISAIHMVTLGNLSDFTARNVMFIEIFISQTSQWVTLAGLHCSSETGEVRFLSNVKNPNCSEILDFVGTKNLTQRNPRAQGDESRIFYLATGFESYPSAKKYL